jgi:hypothetical protein
MLFVGCVIVAVVIGSIVKAINGDDGQKWLHPGDKHRWK